MKKKNVFPIHEQLINASQLPKDALLGASIISMTGNSEILIENFKNIVKYRSDVVILQCKKNQIQIIGKDLIIKHYTNEEIKIYGYITEIKFL